MYFCSFTGINSLFQTLISLNTIVPRMTYSIASSFESLTTKGIPNSIAPLIKVSIDICNETKSYFDFTANSFLRPSIVLQKKFVSHNETDPGVFVIYNDKIRPEAAQFYQQAKKYPKLSNISQYFAQQDFSSYQKTIKELLDDELKLADEMKKLNSFFEYLNDTLQPYYRYVANLTYQKAKGSNETIGEKIAKLKEKSIESFQSLSELNRKSKEICFLSFHICNILHFWYRFVRRTYFSGHLFLEAHNVLNLRCKHCFNLSTCCYNFYICCCFLLHWNRLC